MTYNSIHTTLYAKRQAHVLFLTLKVIAICLILPLMKIVLFKKKQPKADIDVDEDCFFSKWERKKKQMLDKDKLKYPNYTTFNWIKQRNGSDCGFYSSCFVILCLTRYEFLNFIFLFSPEFRAAHVGVEKQWSGKYTSSSPTRKSWK